MMKTVFGVTELKHAAAPNIGVVVVFGGDKSSAATVRCPMEMTNVEERRIGLLVGVGVNAILCQYFYLTNLLLPDFMLGLEWNYHGFSMFQYDNCCTVSLI
jgi:hypothetical protein